MNKPKNKHITPKIIEIEIGSVPILAGSGGSNVDTGGSKVDTVGSKSDLNESTVTNGSWGCAKAPLRQSIGEWNEEEWI